MDGPLIGLTLDHEDDPPRARLRDAYYDAVVAVGGVPVLLPPIAAPGFVERALDLVDGLLVGGGDDLHPSLWGDDVVHPACTLLTARRQSFDLVVVRAALAAGVPLLGICCGMQVMNVAAGGSIVQDLPTEWPGAAVHRAPPGEPLVEHEVRLAEGSLIRRALGGAASIRANSLHHQAVGRVGRGLTATALAPDGVVEAIERGAPQASALAGAPGAAAPAGGGLDAADAPASGAGFALGVQWHPEKLVERREHRALFEALVDAARGRRRARALAGAGAR